MSSIYGRGSSAYHYVRCSHLLPTNSGSSLIPAAAHIYQSIGALKARLTKPVAVAACSGEGAYKRASSVQLPACRTSPYVAGCVQAHYKRELPNRVRERLIVICQLP